MASLVTVGRTRRLGVAMVAVAMVAMVPFVAEGWVSSLLPAFKPGPTPAQQLRAVATDAARGDHAGRAEAERAGVDVDKVIDTVRHNVAPVVGDASVLEARDDAYRARFDGAGFTLALGDTQLGISLQRATRGGRMIDLSTGPWRSNANEALRSVAPGLVEQVSARSGELEWDFVLDAPPSGAGDLRVEAELNGARSAARLEHALRITLADGDKVRMGEVVVKDVTGAELHRALPTVTGTQVALEVPESVLARATYPLTIDPTIGPELPVTGPLARRGAQRLPALAFDGTNYLVVWEDEATPGASFDTLSVVGARVSPSGAVLDTLGVTIANATEIQGAPAVAFDGTNYLVTWVDFRSGAADIFGARVSTAGVLLEGPPTTGGIAISTAAENQAAPAVAFDGTNYLVTWVDFRSGAADIFGARVSTAGVLLDGPPTTGGIAISTAPNFQSAPAVAFDGTNHLVTWADARAGAATNIFGARVSTAGVLLDGPPTTGGIAISTAPNFQSAPAVAFDGTNHLVTWADARAGTADIFAARVSPAGALLDGPAATGGIPISTAAGAQQVPAVAYDGTNHLIVWRDSRGGGFDIFAARVSPAGALLDGPAATGGIPISTAVNSQQLPAVAFDGTNYLVAWSDDRSATDDIFGSRVSTGGALVDGPPVTGGIILSTGYSSQSLPRIAFDGTNYFVVWNDIRSGVVDSGVEVFPRADLFGARVSPTGTILDPTGILIAIGVGFEAFHGPPASAGLIFDGTNYFVVWSADGVVSGTRVSTAGEILDPSPIQISDEELALGPNAAFDGTNYFVVWEENTNFIAGARVSLAGAVLDPQGIDIGPTINPFAFGPGPAIAFDGTNYFVTWMDSRVASRDIVGARVSTAGVLLDGPPDDTGGILLSTAPGEQEDPAVAFDGTRYLVVWRDRRSSPGLIYGTRVTTAGALLDGPPNTGGIPISTSSGEVPAVAANGPFLVVWNKRPETIAARVSGGDGTVQDPAGFVVAASENPLYPPAVIKRPGGWAVSNTRYHSTYGANRVFLRTISSK